MALTKDRLIKRIGSPTQTHTDPVAAGAVIFAGAMIFLNSSGFIESSGFAGPGSCRGVALHSVDNSDGADGDQLITSEVGIFNFKNNGSLTRAHIFNTVGIIDDETVGIPSAIGFAGKLDQIDDDGCWVWIGEYDGAGNP